MARKKGVVKQLSNYGEKHPYVTLALAGTFGYYLYDSMKNGASILPSSSSASYTSSSAPMSDEAFALMMDDIARIDGVYRVRYGANFSSPSITTDMDQRSAQIIKANLDDALNSRAAMSSAQIAKLEALNTLINNAYPVDLNGFRRISGLGMTTSTSTTTSSSHGVPGMLDGSTGEMSMDIDPTKSGLFGVGRSIRPDPQSDRFLNEQLVTKSISGGRRNPPAHLMYDKSRDLGNLGSHCNGLGSHCNARGNPHCHCGSTLSGYSPSARRRVGHAGIGMATESYEPTLDTQFSNQEAMLTGDLKKHEDILGFSGLMPLSGGDWYE